MPDPSAFIPHPTEAIPSTSAEIVATPSGESRSMNALLPHPVVLRLDVRCSTQELSFLSQRGEATYLSPVLITQDHVILDGYAIWELAKLQRRQTLLCVTRHMTEEEALLYIIDRNRASKGISDFIRILMALELEPWFRLCAKANQRDGGRRKGSTELPEAQSLDVRNEIASAAGVSAGNVSKVKHILHGGIPELQSVLRSGDISIHRGAGWAKAPPAMQRSLIADRCNHRGIHRTIRLLLKKHETRRPSTCEGLRDVQRGLSKLEGEPLFSPMLSLLERLISGIDLLLNEAEGRNRAA